MTSVQCGKGRVVFGGPNHNFLGSEHKANPRNKFVEMLWKGAKNPSQISGRGRDSRFRDRQETAGGISYSRDASNISRCVINAMLSSVCSS